MTCNGLRKKIGRLNEPWIQFLFELSSWDLQ